MDTAGADIIRRPDDVLAGGCSIGELLQGFHDVVQDRPRAACAMSLPDESKP